MKATFQATDGVEFVELSGFHGKDVVVRVATEADRASYFQEYAAFKAGPVAPVAVVVVPEVVPVAVTEVEAGAETTPAESPKAKKSFFGKKHK